MAKPRTTRKVWMYSPPKPPAPKVPAGFKDEVQRQANELVTSTLRPRYIKPPPKDNRFNYVVDIFTKWYRHYFYFCATFCSPGPNAIAPSFEERFARMEYIGGDRFNLAFMRHNGQWVDIYHSVSLQECLESVRDDPFFQL